MTLAKYRRKILKLLITVFKILQTFFMNLYAIKIIIIINTNSNLHLPYSVSHPK